MTAFAKRTWIEIDLDKLKANYRTACSLTEATVTCVLKSNAYGHGAVSVARVLQQEGCHSFAVSCAREALELRQAGITGELLVMGLCEAEWLAAMVGNDVTLTIASVEDMIQAEAAAKACGRAAHLQLKINTGFHRLGFDCTEEAAHEIAQAASTLCCARIEGLYSHLGLINKERDEMQHAALMNMQQWLADEGIKLDDVHICDSIGLVRYPAWHHSRVRAGAILFGVRPSRSDHMPFSCRETLTFKTTIAQIHQVSAGEIVGYGDDMPLTRDSRIATLCVGYGDGYPRHLSNGQGQVLIHGQLCPVIGLVCMDQTMVDVTDLPNAKPGDEATLLGGGIDYMTYSSWCRTNRNECITILSRRPQRVYMEGGAVRMISDELIKEKGEHQ